MQSPQDACVSLTSSTQHARALESRTEFRSRIDSDERGCKPTGVAMTSDGRIVVIDDHNRKVKVFSQEGDLEREVCPQGEALPADPWDIAVTLYGNFVITDKGNSVKILDQDGELVTSFGVHLRNPWGVCVNSRGHVIVTDVDLKSVFVHESTGTLKFEIKSSRHHLVFPEYVTTNSNDDVIVSDFYAHAIFVFGALGDFRFRIHSWFPTGSYFNHPCGVTCDTSDRILIADYENARVCEFTAHGQFVRYALTKTDFIRAPQCLVCSQDGALVLVDGTEIKVFDAAGTGSRPVPPRRKLPSRSESYRLSIALGDEAIVPRLRRKTYAPVLRAPPPLPEESESKSGSSASGSDGEQTNQSQRSTIGLSDDVGETEVDGSMADHAYTTNPKIASRTHPPISKKPAGLQPIKRFEQVTNTKQNTTQNNRHSSVPEDRKPKLAAKLCESESGFTRNGSIRKPLINKIIQQLGIDDSKPENEASNVTSLNSLRTNETGGSLSPAQLNSVKIPQVFKDI